MTLVIHSISHAQRQKKKAARANAMRDGTAVKPERFSQRAQEAHVVAASRYFLNPTPEQARALGLDAIGNDPDHVAVRTSNYMADHRGQAERVRFVADQNFRYADTVEERQTEMLALMAQSGARTDAFEHIVLSLRRGTAISNTQREALPRRFIELLGAGDHHAFVVWHADTDHEHAHVGLSRISPEGEVVQLGNRWLLDTIGQANAIIEYENGWEHEANSVFVANARGVFSRTTGVQVRDAQWNRTGVHENYRARADAQLRTKQADLGEAELKLSAGAREHERQHGTWSAERTAKLLVRPQIEAAISWRDLHERLAALGVRYEKFGSGARLHVGDAHITASTAHYAASIAKLSTRLGAFEDRGDIPVADYELRVLAGSEQRGNYTAAKAARADAERSERRISERTSKRAHDMLAAEHARVQQQINVHNWSGRGNDLNVCRSLAGAVHREAVNLITDARKRERRELRERYRPMAFEYWLEYGFPEPEDDALQKRAKRWFLLADGAEWKAPGVELDGYTIERNAHEWRYVRHGKVRFVDRGNIVDIPEAHDRESVRAPLIVAARKWGKVTATGDRQFLAMVGSLAAELDIDVTNPELQRGIARRREALAREREKADLLAIRARTHTEALLRHGNLVRRRDGRYGVDDRKLVEHYLPDGLEAHPAAQAVLRAEHKRQVPLLERLGRDIAKEPSRFRVGDRGIRITTDYITDYESGAWLRDPDFHDKCQRALREAEKHARERTEELKRKLRVERNAVPTPFAQSVPVRPVTTPSVPPTRPARVPQRTGLVRGVPPDDPSRTR